MLGLTPRRTPTAPPHPLILLGGVVVLIAAILLGLTQNFPRSYFLVFLICFLAAFRSILRWSGRRQLERRRKELEEIRRKPVLGLND
jgi:hypothetical protein